MSDERSLIDKVLAGEVSIDECDLETDFTVDDLEKLLQAEIIEPENVTGRLAVELMRSGVILCENYPIEDLEPTYQLDLLEADEMDAESFLERVDLTSYSGSDWLRLVVCCHSVEDQAPWDKIRAEATAEEWGWSVVRYPYLMKFMDVSCLQKCSLEQLERMQKAVAAYLELAKKVEEERKEQVAEDLMPENELEKAILDGNAARTLYAIIDHEVLSRPDVLVTSAFLELSKPIAVFVLQNGLESGLWKRSIVFWQKHPIAATALSDMITGVEEVITKEVAEGEQKLLLAIVNHSDEEVHDVIYKDGIRLSFSPYLLAAIHHFLHLQKKTLVMLLSWGLHKEVQPMLLKFLLMECSEVDKLKDLNYKQRLMITNLMIHIMAGQITTEDEQLIEEDWYPMGNSIVDGADPSIYCHSYGYYYDPRHVYEPRNADDSDYEKPTHRIFREE